MIKVKYIYLELIALVFLKVCNTVKIKMKKNTQVKYLKNFNDFMFLWKEKPMHFWCYTLFVCEYVWYVCVCEPKVVCIISQKGILQGSLLCGWIFFLEEVGGPALPEVTRVHSWNFVNITWSSILRSKMDCLAVMHILRCHCLQFLLEVTYFIK